MLFFYVTISPVSNWLVPTSVLVAERFLYLPSVGLCLVAGLFVDKTSRHAIEGDRCRRGAGCGWAYSAYHITIFGEISSHFSEISFAFCRTMFVAGRDTASRLSKPDVLI